jgi:hypothetical protein
MSKIEEFYEAEIQENAANNPNPIPNGTHVGVIPSPDFAEYWQWMDEQIDSLVRAVGRG